MDASILTTLNLINMGIPRVIAKAVSFDHGSVLTKKNWRQEWYIQKMIWL